jgi:L-ascorbate metabolism protein UlaG (beta-lactamase superfamily)
MARLFLALLFLLAPRLAFAGCGPIAMQPPRVWLAATADPSLTITFLGHASFLLETPGGVRAVTDYSVVFAPADPPDLVTMNHAHESHYTLSPDPRIRTVLHGWQEGPKPPSYDVRLGDLRVTNLPTNIRNWNGGTEINGNSIFIFEAAGLCVAHLGHLHHLLEPADLDALGRIDILMVMVDGGYSLGQRDARAVVEQIHPRVVLPMHYFTRDRLASFLDTMRDAYAIQVQDSPTVALSRATLPERPTVIALPGPH